MAQLYQYCAFLLVLIACNGSLLTRARLIKATNEDSSLKPCCSNDPLSPEKEHEAPEKPKYNVAASGDSSGAGNANAFPPTTAGSSPGDGHRKIAGQDRDMNAKVAVHNPDFEHYVTQDSTNDFRPTNPGHSPGIGHMLDNKN